MGIWSTPLGRVIATLFISMVPVLELRGAIPIAVANGMAFLPAMAVSFVGNLLPVPFIIVFIRRVFALMRRYFPKLGGLVTRLEKRAAAKKEIVLKYEFWGLFILVAIPLPGTGAWTGALVAAMMDMRLKRAFPAIAMGVAVAAIIVAFVTYGAGTVFAA